MLHGCFKFPKWSLSGLDSGGCLAGDLGSEEPFLGSIIASYVMSYAWANDSATWIQASERYFGPCICSNSGRELSLPKTSPKKALKHSEREAGEVPSISILYQWGSASVLAE
ncbi:hypothetical protein ACFX2G_023046 [Malus domestica]